MKFKHITFAIFFLLSTVLFTACSQSSAPDQQASEAEQQATALQVLMVGGGSSHDFDTWFKGADAQTLSEGGTVEVTYLDDVTEIGSKLPNTDVLLLTNNQPIEDPATREAIFSFVEQGKGLVLAHAALWYNWKDWPEYNQQLVGGGSNGHDEYGEFEVEINEASHPVMKDVPASFTLADELYYYKVDEEGPGIEVLATAKRLDGSDSFPSVFVVKNPKARIVGIALGHDAASHELQAYKTILVNAVNWVANTNANN